MTRNIATATVLLVLVLGGCSGEQDQQVTTTSTPSQADTPIDDNPPGLLETGTSDPTVYPNDPTRKPREGIDTGAEIVPPTPTDRDATAPPPDDAAPLPEPGDGLVHPKSPDTTKVVPPPQD